MKFEIKEEFILNDKPIKIISGAIHYFRMTTSQWEDSLYNLKALGANTVETYIPWNIHEPKEGIFDFEGNKNIFAFIEQAQKLGLLVILRPSVYICAEWEFGGLPPWLLKEKGIRLRSSQPQFMDKVSNYFSILLPLLAKYQITQGGPVIMMQIENEYGSYGMEKEYLRQTHHLMLKNGIDIPMFTSDGSWEEVLDAGSLIEDDIFVTGNFGSQSKENSKILRNFMERHQKKWPLMCMEYWDGWFNRWGEKIIKRDADDLANEVKAMLEVGSLNLYMFHGGTNFGFYNGCSARKQKDLPQITSYDYDALLTESGDPTEKYYAIQRVIREICPDVWQASPRTKTYAKYGTLPVYQKVSLHETLNQMAKPQSSTYPLTMEEVGSGYGYVYYQATLKNYNNNLKIKMIDTHDRAQLFIDHKHIITQYQEEIGDEILLPPIKEKPTLNLSILVENLGRVNYGHKLNAPSQTKGIRGGLMIDHHFHQGFTQYSLDLNPQQVQNIDFTKDYHLGTPSFYKFKAELTNLKDTYIDCRKFGKGVILVNGINLGRYWNRGPIQHLYCPKDFLIQGNNEFIIFETEGIPIKELKFSNQPIFSN